MTKPDDFRHTYTTTGTMPYEVVEGTAKGSQNSKGSLGLGRVIWLRATLEEATSEHMVPAYAEGIGIITVDSRMLRAVKRHA
jgi:hypothetical protein